LLTEDLKIEIPGCYVYTWFDVQMCVYNLTEDTWNISSIYVGTSIAGVPNTTEGGSKAFIDLNVFSALDPLRIFPALGVPQFIKNQRAYGFLSGFLISLVITIALSIFMIKTSEQLFAYKPIEPTGFESTL